MYDKGAPDCTISGGSRESQTGNAPTGSDHFRQARSDFTRFADVVPMEWVLTQVLLR